MEPITAIIVVGGIFWGFYEGQRFERKQWVETFHPSEATSLRTGAERA